jgi:hypothetical protein
MNRKRAISITFVVACAATAHFTGTLGRFLVFFAVLTLVNFVVYVGTWKVLTWWHEAGRYRIRRRLN